MCGLRRAWRQVAASNLERISDTNGYSFRNANSQIQKYVDSDHSQKVMQCFFIIILSVIGLLVYFNTAFTNLLNRRNDFKIMHKIGIRKKEMCWMAMERGDASGLHGSRSVSNRAGRFEYK